MLTRLGGTFYRARWTVLIISLFVIVAAAIYGFGIFGSLKTGGFADPASESSKAQNLLDSKFPNSSADAIILMHSDTLHATDATFMDAATQLLTTLKARPEITSITSYYSTHSSRFLSRDAHETFAIVHLSSSDESIKEQEYKAISPLITSPTLQIMVGGNVPVSIAINQQVSADLERAEMITLPIVVILLLIVFSGLVAAALPLLIGGITILGAFAVLRVLAGLTDVSVFAIQVVTMLGLGLAIDYSLFVITRFREELKYEENDVRGAVQRTMTTAGRTILFSGLTVSTSLLSLPLFPEFFLRSMGMGTIAATLVALLASLTILPAVLALLGKRVNAFSIQRLFQRASSRSTVGSNEVRGIWYRLSQAVMHWPILVALVVVAILALLGTPFLHAMFSTPGVTVLAQDQPARMVSDRLSQDFAQEGSSQLTIAINTPGNALSATNLSSLNAYVRSISAIPGVIRVDSLVTVNPLLSLADYQQIYAHPAANPQLAAVASQLANGDTTQLTVAMQGAERSSSTEDVVRQVRAIHTPKGFMPLVNGITPEQMDQLVSLGATLPYALAVIAVAVFVLLFLMTGSLLMPLKAVILNMLSLSATFGALVWIFQDGHLQNILHFQSLGSLDSTQPILIFAIAFGLSMDYEVFLLSRIKECFDATGNNRAAIASGIQRTGWLITSAAVLLAVVLGAFGSSRIIFIQEIGIGLAIAVIMDATLVRMLLVPATMRLLGRWNWWAPAPLRALWRRVGLSESTPRAASSIGLVESALEEVAKKEVHV